PCIESIDQFPAWLMEGEGPVELTDSGSMGDDLAHAVQSMNGIARRFQRPGRGGILSQIQTDLVGHRGSRAGNGSAKADLYIAMQMSADHSFHIAVLTHNRLQLFRSIEQANLVHMADQGVEGGMVQGNDGGPLGLLGQLGCQPVQLVLVQAARTGTRYGAIQGP